MTENEKIRTVYELLGHQSQCIIEEFGIPEKILSSYFDAIQHSFDNVSQVIDGDSISGYLHHKIEETEQLIADELNLENLNDLESIEIFSAKLLNTAPNRECLFLKDRTIDEIFKSLPPTNTRKLLKKIQSDRPTKEYNSRQILSITRHSESGEWQSKYQNLIKNLSPKDFEYRQIDVTVWDSRNLIDIFKQNGHQIKPWLLSHSKETGIVNFFTPYLEKTYPSQRVMVACVFFHYLFEIKYASSFFKKLIKDEVNFGLKVSQLINNDRKSFAFLTDKNVYDETIYWDKALERIYEEKIFNNLKIFEQTRLLGFFKENTLISYNLIDLLWNNNLDLTLINNSGSLQAFNYHFRQALWSDIIFKSSELTNSEVNEIIIANLEKEDGEITKMLLKKSQQI